MAYGRPIVLQDYQPDADPRTPGVLVDCDNVFGSVKGLRTLPSFVSFGAVLPAPSLGVFVATLVSGDKVVVAGTATHLYRLVGATWQEFDSGQTFAAIRWRFDVLGNDIIAVDSVDPPQVSRAGQPFIPLATISDIPPLGPPPAPLTAMLVVVVDEGVFLVPPQSNQWAFSISDTVWTPNNQTLTVNTFAPSAGLTGTPGPILGGHRIRGGVVFYKIESMFFGQFTGPPFFWQFTSISENVGAVSNEAIINTGDVHMFLAVDDFYQFDGSSLQRIPNNLKEWFFRRVDINNLDKVQGRWDRTNSLAVWYYPTADATPPGSLNESVLFNVRTGKWTKGVPKDADGNSLVVTDVVQPNFEVALSVTYAQLGEMFATYADLPNVPYNSPLFGHNITEVGALITSSGELVVATGASTGGFITTGEIGDGNVVWQLSRVRPVFALWPLDNTGKLQSYKRRINGYPIPDPNPFPQPGFGPTTWLTKHGDFNLIIVARSHQLRIDVSAEAEITALELDMLKVGLE